MLHIHTKTQNRSRIWILFFLGIIWSWISIGSKEFMPIIIDSVLFIALTVMAGNITRWFFEKAGFDPVDEAPEKELLLDVEQKEPMPREIEDRKDISALNYAIGWALVLIFLSLFQ